MYLVRTVEFLGWFIQSIKYLFLSKKDSNNNILGLIRICSLKRLFLLKRIFTLFVKMNLNSDEEKKRVILKKISKIVLKFQLVFDNKYLGDANYLSIKLDGWARNESMIFLLHPKKTDVNTKLIRRDLIKILGKSYKYSGFNLIFKSVSELRELLSDLNIPGSKIDKSEVAIHGEFLNDYFRLNGFFKHSVNKNPSLNFDSIGFIVDPKVLNLDSFFVACLIFRFPILFKQIFHTGNTNINHLLINILKRDKWYAYNCEFLTSEFIDKHPDLFDSNFTPIQFVYELQTSTAPQLCELKDARVFHQRFVVDKMRTFANQFPESYNRDLIAGVSTFLIKKSKANSKSLVLVNSDNCLNLKNALLLPTRVPDNWFHYIFESLPGLLHFKNDLPTDIPILLHEKCPTQIKELISAIGFSNFLYVNQYHVLNIDTLFTFNSSALIPDSLTANLNDFKINFDLLHKLSSYLNKFYNDKQNPVSQNSIYFFERRNRSRSAQKSFLFYKILSFGGVQRVNLSNYSFAEQFHFFAKCKILFVEGGASMANFLFMKPNTEVFYLTSKHLGKYLLPSAIADNFRISFHFLFGKSRIRDLVKTHTIYDLFHMNYRISLFRLYKIIKNLSKISFDSHYKSWK